MSGPVRDVRSTAPRHWEWVPLKRAADINKRVLAEDTDPDFTFRYIDITAVRGDGSLGQLAEFRFADAPSRARRVVRGRDVIVSTVRTYLRAIARVPPVREDLICSTGFAVLSARPEVDPRFLYWWARSTPFIEEVVARSVGVGYPAVAPDELGRIPTPIPPRQEQQAIDDFLDRETARIDEMVGKRQQLMRLIKDRLAGVISTMAQGFATGARDSPFWPMALPSVPLGWQVVRLKYLLRGLEQGWSPQCENRLAEPDEWGVLKVGCVKDGTFHSDENKALPAGVEAVAHLEVRSGDILMSRANTRELLGSVAVVRDVRPHLLVCDKVYRLTPDDSLVDRCFLGHALRTASVREQLEAEATGASSSMQNIGQDSVRELLIAIPEVEEQRRIGEAIEEQSRRAEAVLRRVEAAVDRLKEYRQALITAAVTGQMDVSGAAA